MRFREQRVLVVENPDPNERRAGLTRAELAAALEARFAFADDATRDFFRYVYWDCLLAKVRPPEGALRRRWMTPGSRYYGAQAYRGQYVWDTMFMLDALSWLPGMGGIIRDVLGNFWDVQDRWDAVMPEYARGMIGHGFAPATDDAHLPTKTCNPLIAWGVARIAARTGDLALAREAVPRLVRYYDWYWRERDLDGIGLIASGDYAGKRQGMRDEQGYDFAVDSDEFDLIPHPARPDGPAHYADLYGVAPTAYVVQNERCLADLAEMLGDPALAAARRARAERGAAAMRAHLWDEEAGVFRSMRRDGTQVRAVAIGSWMPLLAGVPTPAQAARMIAVLSTPEWMTPLPVPTVGRTDPQWQPGRFAFLPDPPRRLDHLGQPYNMWRGDVWPPTNYQVAAGLHAYGAADLAARICDATIMNALLQGDLNERYDCDTGAPLGPGDFGMSACVIAMVLDGLTRRYRATAR